MASTFSSLSTSHLTGRDQLSYYECDVRILITLKVTKLNKVSISNPTAARCFNRIDFRFYFFNFIHCSGTLVFGMMNTSFTGFYFW